MKKLLWKIYYKFKGKPETFSGIMIMYARTNGLEYVDIEITEIALDDFLGNITWN